MHMHAKRSGGDGLCFGYCRRQKIGVEVMDWYELRFHCSYWFKQSWPFRCLAWLLSKRVPEQKGFGKFKERD